MAALLENTKVSSLAPLPFLPNSPHTPSHTRAIRVPRPPPGDISITPRPLAVPPHPRPLGPLLGANAPPVPPPTTDGSRARAPGAEHHVRVEPVQDPVLYAGDRLVPGRRHESHDEERGAYGAREGGNGSAQGRECFHICRPPAPSLMCCFVFGPKGFLLIDLNLVV